MGYIIGIDLGTTNSVVAYLEGGKPQVMQNAEGSKTTPSIVLYQPDGQVIVGELAKRQRLIHPQRSVSSVKRFVGCRWDESEERRQGLSYPLVPHDGGLVAVQIDEQTLLPEQVQSQVLLKMKETAEEYLGEEIRQAIITCPAYFNDSQRQATKKAAELAGLEALRIINEPTAAALAYGLGKEKNQRVAVFDFGGGTFDISILELDGDVFEVKSTCGDTFLGGDTIDRILTEWIVERIAQEQGLDVTQDMQALSRVTEAAEKAKCELSTLEQTTLALPFIGAGADGPKHFNATLSRKQFEELIEPVLERLEGPCIQAIKDASLATQDIHTVILVGGSTRIPAVQRMVKTLFGRDPERSINPDEAVALGAAIQAGVMNGELAEILLLDVTPLSLGIELAGGIFAPLINRNSSIPTTARRKFTTVRDNQASVVVHVLQGERKQASENRTLARFRLEGIAPAPREVPEIEVSFNIDANGILNVAAMDLTTAASHQITVESYQPTLEAAEHMVEEATQHVSDDRVFVRKSGVRRRMEELAAELDQYRKTTGVRPLGETQELELREAFFRLEVTLAQDDFSLIEQAERDLKAMYSEIMLMAGMGMGQEADQIVFEQPAKLPGSKNEAAQLDLTEGLSQALSQTTPSIPPPKE